MPSMSLTLRPGVDTTRTPALNEAGIAQSNMIRFREGLVEKRGGWLSYAASVAASAIRALWAYQDQFFTRYVAVGATNALKVIANGAAVDITPRTVQSMPTNAFSTTSGSNLVTVTDPNYTPGSYDLVNIPLTVSVGGIAFTGTYPVYRIVGGSQYQIQVPNSATSSVSNGGSVAGFTTTAGSAAVSVYQPNHGYAAGSTYAVGVAVNVGGLVLQGAYTILSVTDANDFVIQASTVATSSAGASINAGKPIINYTLNTPKGNATAGGPVAAADWSLYSYGSVLMACPAGGGIYTWTAASPYQAAQLIPNAPAQCRGIMVADAQQMVIAYGVVSPYSFTPNTVAWCDAGNFNTWTASGTNQAGSFPLPTGSGIVGGAVGPQQNLLWTDIDLWAMTYQGYPLVWGFTKLATGCGLVAQFAWVRLGSAVLWMSQRRFWIYDGAGVRPLPCPVWDSVFPLISQPNAWKIRGASNSGFGEAIWFFPSASGSGENDSYVCFNIVEGTWDLGSMARSAWLDQSLIGQPLGGDPQGNVFQHEVSPDAAGTAIAASFTTGWFLVDEGEGFSFVDFIRPDIKFPLGAGTVQVSVLTCRYTTDTPVVTGPYSITSATEFINTRCRGRYVALQLASSDVGSFWRVGRPQMRFTRAGRN